MMMATLGEDMAVGVADWVAGVGVGGAAEGGEDVAGGATSSA